MSEEEIRRPSPDAWPPEWLEQADREGMAEPPIAWRINGWGAAYITVWWNVPESTPFERRLVAGLATGLRLLRDEEAVAMARALLEAQCQRADLADDAGRGRIADAWWGLTWEQRTDPGAILAVVTEREVLNELVDRRLNANANAPRGLSDQAAEGLAPRGPGRPKWRRGPFDEDLESAYRLSKDPKTIPELASHFVALDGTVGVDPRYLRRLMARRRRGELPE
jgi:hypothetical protein